MKHLLDFLSFKGRTARGPYWRHTLGATLALGIGQALSMGANCLMQGDYQHYAALADIVGLASILPILLTSVIYPLFDSPAAQPPAAEALPWLWGMMALGWLISFSAAWRIAALSARRLRDLGKSRVHLLLPYLSLPLALAFSLAGLFALWFCQIWLLLLYCRPGKAD